MSGSSLAGRRKLPHKGSTGDLKMPLENYEEVRDGSTDEEKDLLFGWIKEEEVKAAILFDEKVDSDLVARVINEGYAPDRPPSGRLGKT